ncbi:MAG TPA: hypothetical protein VGS58_02955, partial [Candidatus Sulfopaludibacter sp.]|nr:hypothetical protein [Candidatus Sulfopaludibacter sp.]
LYAGDDFWLRARGPKGISTVTVQPYYAVPLRNGKTEIMLLDPEDQQCVQSIFPHKGYDTCWYLKGHTQKRIQM